MRAKYKKHPRLSSNSMINSSEFFLFTVIFLKPFFFFRRPFLWILFHVIYHDFFTILIVHVWVRFWKLLPFPSHTSLNLLLLAVRLLVYCSGVTSTLMRSESWLGSIYCGGNCFYRYLLSFILILYPVFTHPPVVKYP